MTLARLPIARSLALLGLLGVTACTSEPLEVPPSQSAPAESGSSSGGGSAAQAGDYALKPYPAGPYGRTIGSTIENLEFLGWHDPVAAGYDASRFETVRLSDYYNPEGLETGPKLLVLNASAVWCSVCRAEFRQLHDNAIYDRYHAQGVEIIGALFEDNDYQPAKPSDLSAWGSYENHAVEFPLVLDPGFKLGAYFAGDVTPLNLLVDARSMQILDVTMGYDPSDESSYWQMIDQWLSGQ